MARLHLVRHGRAAAAFDRDTDPGLDDFGRSQAEAVAARLAGLGPLPVLCSPLRRTRETAQPFERLWRVTAGIEPAVAEIPSPVADLAERGIWLRSIMPRRWPELGPELQAWREQVLSALRAIRSDAVVVTHFIAINVAVGAATGDDRVVSFRPDNGSCTIVETGAQGLTLVERGAEGATRVL